MPSKPFVESQKSIESQLDEILVHLRKLDRRDRLRTWSGFIRSTFALVSIILFVWSGWYFVSHADEMMKKIADTAASSAAEYTKKQSQGVLDQFLDQYTAPKK